MLKIFGIAIVVGVCGYLGYLEKDNLRQRENQLQAMIFAVNMMADRISYGREPLDVILQKTAESLQGVAADFLAATGSELSRGNGRVLSEIWCRQLKAFRTRAAFNESDYTVLKDLAEGLGVSHTEDQLQKLHLSLGRLEQNYLEAKASRERLGKVFQASGWCLGMVLVLLFA
mgnify:CR=1 FL=1